MSYGSCATTGSSVGIVARQSLRAKLVETREVLIMANEQTGIIRNIIEPEVQNQASGPSVDDSLLSLSNELLIMARMISSRLDGIIETL